MDAESFTPAQRHAIVVAAAARRDWFQRLRARMDAQRWREDCPVYLAAVAAHDALHRVVVAAADSAPKEPEPDAPRTWQHGSEPASAAERTASMPWVGKARRRRRR